MHLDTARCVGCLNFEKVAPNGPVVAFVIFGRDWTSSLFVGTRSEKNDKVGGAGHSRVATNDEIAP